MNDRLGHEVGDRVLREVAARLVGAVREGDVVARLGGDEFAVLAPACRHVDAEALADRIVDVIGAPIDTRCGPVIVGVSVGIAIAADGAAGAPDVLLEAADAAMYRAKEAGGGRWVRA